MTFAQRIREKLSLKLWREGKAFSIYFLISAHPTAKEVVESLSDEKEGRMTRAFLVSLSENKKVLFLKKRSKQIEKNLYRLRTTNQLRFLYFYDQDSAFIITHAFIKKGDAIPPEEIEKAKRLRDEYYEKKKELGL